MGNIIMLKKKTHWFLVVALFIELMILNNDMTQTKNANNIMEVSSLNYVGSDNHGYLFDKYGWLFSLW